MMNCQLVDKMPQHKIYWYNFEKRYLPITHINAMEASSRKKKKKKK